MPIAAAIGAAGTVVSAGISAYGANKAVKAQQGMFNTARGELQPFIDAGKDAINPLQRLINPGPDQTAALESMPGYAFARDQGLKAITNQGSTRGVGGNVMREANNFATQNALQQSWLPQVNALQSLINTGANSGGNLSTAATTTGTGQASTIASGANAVGGAANNLGNIAQNYALFNKLTGTTPASAPGVYGEIANPAAWNGLR